MGVVVYALGTEILLSSGRGFGLQVGSAAERVTSDQIQKVGQDRPAVTHEENKYLRIRP